MNIVTLTEENFDEVISQNSLVIVDFWAEWCAPCKNFAKVYEEVAQQHPEFVFGKINTEEQPALANDFDIRSIPTVMILREKIMVYCEAGALPAAALHDLLEQTKALNIEEVRQQLSTGAEEA